MLQIDSVPHHTLPMPKLQTSVRLSQATMDDLRFLAEHLRVSMASCIEMAVAEMARRVRAELPAKSRR